MRRKVRDTAMFLMLGLLLFTLSCASSVYDVTCDCDTEMDLTHWRTYDWLPIPEEIETDDVVVARVEKATDAEMTEKGFLKVSENPDFLIAMHTGREEKVALNRDWQWEYVYSDYFINNRQTSFQYLEGMLVLDIVDGESKQLVWQGQGKGFVGRKPNPKQEDKLVKQAVHKILKNFPPPNQMK
jgi:hypothetical protein